MRLLIDTHLLLWAARPAFGRGSQADKGSPRRRSIASALLDHQGGSRHPPFSEDLLHAGCEVWPFARLGS
jgi:hypothetical protein